MQFLLNNCVYSANDCAIIEEELHNFVFAAKGRAGPKHPNKHIREAIEYAQSLGWRLIKTQGHTHVWAKLLCPLESRDGCFFNIHSTPRNPEAHADRIQRAVDNCDHA